MRKKLKKSSKNLKETTIKRPEKLMRHDLTSEEEKIRKMADLSRTLFLAGLGCLVIIILILILIATLLLVGKGTNLLGL